MGFVAFVVESGLLAPAALAGGIAYLSWVELYRKVRERANDPLEALATQYAEGEITLAQYEREVELLEDDRNDALRAALEGVNGVGPATARDVALRFESLDELRRVDRDELEAVHGVGPSTAEAIRTELGAE